MDPNNRNLDQSKASSEAPVDEDTNVVGSYKIGLQIAHRQGGFSDVFVGHHKTTHKKDAVKRFKLKNESYQAMLKEEIDYLKRIPPHEHVLEIYETHFQDQACFVAMEWCDQGNLQEFMKRNPPDIDGQLNIMRQCASAIAYFHSLAQPIIHRNIEPKYILMKQTDEKFMVKILAFGLSSTREEETTDDTEKGAYYFMPPERVVGKRLMQSGDTFSLGLVFLSIITFNPAYGRMLPISDTAIKAEKLISVGKEMANSAAKGASQPRVVANDPRDSPKLKEVKSLIRNMTEYKPEKRKSMNDVLKCIEEIQQKKPPRSEPHKGFTTKVAKQEMNKGNKRSQYNLNRAKLEEGEEMPMDTDDSDSDDEEKTDSPNIAVQYFEEMMKTLVGQAQQAAAAEAFAPGFHMLLNSLYLSGSSDSSPKKFEIGDKVVFQSDVSTAQKKQEGHGGWVPAMEQYFDEEGKVKQHVFRDTIVQFKDGARFLLNSDLLTKCNPNRNKPSKLPKRKFKVNDVVKIVETGERLRGLQRERGGFHEKMPQTVGIKGIVRFIFHNGGALVAFFNGFTWQMHEDALQVVDTSNERAEAGDFVMVLDDKDKVKEQQKGHGEWVEKMSPCLGELGVVKERKGDIVIVGVQISQHLLGEPAITVNTWAWNAKSLTVLGKFREMLEIARQGAK